ncbi:MAG: NFACT family protein [Nanoarchaeota archaeon]
MDKQFSALELTHIYQEAKGLVESRVDNIYMYSHDDFMFRLHSAGRGKSYLRVCLPDMTYLAEHIPPSPPHPPNFCLLLRKHLKGAILKHVYQVPWERILELTFQAGLQLYRVYIELFAKGNLILCKGEENTIVAATLYKEWSDRGIKRFAQYELPPSPALSEDLDEEQFLSRFEASRQEEPEMPVSKWLATTFGLGGVYSREACARAGLDNILPLCKVTDAAQLFSILMQMYTSSDQSATVVMQDGQVRDVTPFPMRIYADEEAEEYASFSLAIDHVMSLSMKDRVYEAEMDPRRKKLEKEEKIMEQQRQQEKGLTQQIAHNTGIADAIYAHYQQISDILATVQVLAKQYRGQELADRLLELPGISDVDMKSRTLKVDLDATE